LTEERWLLVLGLGNRLCRDDGIGSVLAERLAGRLNVPCVEVIDGGTVGLGLLYLFEDYSDVFILDATDMGGQPGTILRMSPADLGRSGDGTVSFHQSGLAELIQHAHLLGCLPSRLVVWTIQVKSVEPKIGLSPELEAKVPALERFVEEEIRAWVGQHA